MSGPRPPAAGGMVAASAALALTTLVGALSLGRLFSGSRWVVPVLAAALAGHLLAWGLRRLAVGGVVAYLISSSFVVVAVAWLALPHTTFYGIPGPGFLSDFRTEMARAIADFRVVVAPTSPTSGFVAAAVFGAAVAGLLSDWAAFRVRASFEALLPSFTLFLFSAVLGSSRYRAFSVAAYVIAATAFLVIHQAGLEGGGTAWFATRTKHTGPAVAKVFAAMTAATLLAALVIAPHFPGAGAEPVISYRNNGGSGPGDRVTISPLVDIRGRLIDNTNAVVFTVKANHRAYWRLTSLDSFDGNIWSSDGSYRPVKRRLPVDIPRRVPTTAVRQEFQIIALSAIWLPAAFEPTRIEGMSGTSYEVASGSLISRSETSDGLAYTVLSEQPQPTPAELTQGSNLHLPVDVRDRYLRLPRVDSAIVAEARRIVAGKPTPYDKAKALQDSFRDGRFTYNIRARPGHDEFALRRFLFGTREGYCEQFAGAYGVMARAVGLPTRVAVGFTPGQLDPATGRFVVRGINAHAWPEVYIEGSGWVAFEPTPGRGAPGAEQYTGVPEAQASAVNPNASVTTPTTAAADPRSTNTTRPERGQNGGSGSSVIRPRSSSRSLVALALVLLGLVIAMLTVPATRRWLRGRRRRRVTDPGGRIELAWQEMGRVLSQAGTGPRSSETATEFTRRASRDRPALGADLAELSRCLTVASFAPWEPTEEDADRAERAGAEIERAVVGALRWRARLAWELDPRPLWAERATRQTLSSGRAAA